MASKWLNILVLLICCKVILGYPQNSSNDALIDVEDTDDEFIIKKPASQNDPEYNKFLEELYRQDGGKQQTRSKRNSDDEHLPLPILPDEFDIPDKPKSEDKNYESFVKELYRQDTLKRNKRMIVFRLIYRIEGYINC